MRGSLTFISLLVVLVFCTFSSVKAQQGTLEGVVTEEQTGEPIPFINVVLLRGGSQVAGTETNMDGEYRMGNLEPGDYTMRISSVNHQNVEITNIEIRPDAIIRENVTMSSEELDLEEYEVRERRQPLIEVDDATSGRTISRTDIENLPSRSISDIASLTGGVSSQDGGTPNIRGQRSDGTVYYVDGVRIRGLQGVPQSAVEQVNTQIGGLPARYGDATGGVISISTRGAAEEFTGGAEFITSQYLDPYGYNEMDVHATGPLWKRENEDGDEETVLGYFVAGEFGYRGDYSPQGFGIHTIDDETSDLMREDPIMANPDGGGFIPRAETITEDNIEEVRSRPNSDQWNYNVNTRFDVNISDNVTLQAGGQLGRRERDLFSYSFSMFSPETTPVEIRNTYRGYGRLTHSFDIDQEEDARFEIQDAYYNLHFDYTGNFVEQYDPNLEDNFFQYGHLGTYDIYNEPTYSRESRPDVVGGQNAFHQNGFRDTLVEFEASQYNEPSARYTEAYFERARQPTRNLQQLQQQNALRNGDQPPLIYSIWRSPGTFYTSYGEADQEQINANARGAVTIEGHELSFGVQFEQRVERNYNITASNLWNEMRQLVNEQFDGFDTDNPNVVRDDKGVFQDTVRYNRNITDNQSNFDENFRNKLIEQGATDVYGNPIDETTELNPDRYDPEMFDIEMFSPSELFRGGSQSIVSYEGFDHHGNRLRGDDADVPFFDSEGNIEFQESGRLSAFSPIYTAAYIQDKFSFRDLIFNVGVRFDRYDANQQVLDDPYSLYPIRTVNEVDFTDQFPEYSVPDNIDGDYKVYTNSTENPTQVIGFRSGNNWYNNSGEQIDDPSRLADASGGSIQPYLTEEGANEELTENSFKDYEPTIDILPRISFSFPISERSSFHANYDQLTQRPRSNVNGSIVDYYYLENRATTNINNPALRPERRTNYELGFQQRIGQNSALRLQAYYGEIRDMVQITEFSQAYPVSYRSYDNLDFGTVKGLSSEFDFRPLDGNMRVNMSYTLQFADGTGSSQTTQSGLIAVGQPNLRTPMPLDFDVRHDITTNIDYRFGTGEAYNGPETEGGFEILGNTGINFIVNAKSGQPYSRQSNVTQEVAIGVAQRSSLEGSLNSARLPWNFNADIRLNRRIPLTFGGGEAEDGTREATREYGLNVFVWVQNLFDTRNIRSVYQYTGSPDDDGWLTDPEGRQAAQSATSEQAYRDQYSMKAENPGNYFSPRRIRLGASFNF